MEPSIHFAIPFAVASLLGLSLRWSFLAGLIGIIPDFDVLFLVHRSISHSLLPAILLLFILLLLKKISFLNPRFQIPVLISSLGLGSHVILDLIDGYTPFLWPLSENAYYLIFELRLLIESFPTLYFNVNLFERPYGNDVFTTLDAPLFTAEGLILALLLITLGLVISSRGLNVYSIISRKK